MQTFYAISYTGLAWSLLDITDEEDLDRRRKDKYSRIHESRGWLDWLHTNKIDLDPACGFWLDIEDAPEGKVPSAGLMAYIPSRLPPCYPHYHSAEKE